MGKATYIWRSSKLGSSINASKNVRIAELVVSGHKGTTLKGKDGMTGE
jgi:hypothetical protein